MLDNETGVYKCDMHVHSCFSGHSIHLKFFYPHDSFSSPEKIYFKAKKRGMDYVTITDHDSIQGCLDFLGKYPDCKDFFISEEVSTYIQELGIPIHINVYDITEEIHNEITQIKSDATELIKYLNKQSVYYNLNHFFISMPENDKWHHYYDYVDKHFNFLEAYNGVQTVTQNGIFEENTYFSKRAVIGGSDAHTLDRVGKTYTVAHGENYKEFLKNVFNGESAPEGKHMNFIKLFYEFNKTYLQYGVDILKPKKKRLNNFRGFKRFIKTVSWLFFTPCFAAGSLILIVKYYFGLKFKRHKLYKEFYANYSEEKQNKGINVNETKTETA